MAAWAVSKIKLRHTVAGAQDFSDVLAKLTGANPVISGIRRRVLAAERRHNDALETARAAPGLDGMLAAAIAQLAQTNREEAIEQCDAGLSEANLRASTKQAFLIIRARARFHLAIGERRPDEFDLKEFKGGFDR